MSKNNKIFYGILFIIIGIMTFCFSGLLYPLLSIPELLKSHPFLSWGIPLCLITIGWVFIQIEKEREHNDE